MRVIELLGKVEIPVGIVMMDEATANVDAASDAIIQSTVRSARTNQDDAVIYRLRPCRRPPRPQNPRFYFFTRFLGVWSGSMTFLTLLASFLVLELLKMVG